MTGTSNDDPEKGRTSGLAVTVFYGVMAVLAAAAFLVIRSMGERLVAPPPTSPAAALGASQTIDTLFHFLLALAVVIVTARAMGLLFGFIDQPAVVGEIVGGIMLGPSLLGRIAPAAFAQLMPPSVAPFLGMHAQIGVILYMFLVGLELDLHVISKNGHTTIAISHASIIMPFLLGSGLALFLYPVLSSSEVPFTVFALFIGVSLSVTAFPVLARILTDRKLSRTRMGTIALTCAAVDDVTAWCLLALVVSMAQERPSDAGLTVALTIAFICLMLAVIRPLVRRVLPLVERSSNTPRAVLGLACTAMLASAMATEYIGIHGIFGAFLFGAVVPHQSRIASALKERMEDVVAILFLPAFFAFTGMRTEIGLVSGLQNWLLCAAIIVLACAGKFGGTLIASRLTGLRWRDSAALGVLMNTRGLVELIVLNVGLDLGVISPRLFTMLVIMAIVTTFMTTPVLHLIIREHPWVDLNLAPPLEQPGNRASRK